MDYLIGKGLYSSIMFSRRSFYALVVFIASASSLAATPFNATNEQTDKVADVSEPHGFRCVVSKGPCEVAGTCKLDIEPCSPGPPGTLKFCMAAGQLNGTHLPLVWDIFTGTPNMTECMSDDCKIQPRGNSSFICCCQADVCNLPPRAWIGAINETVDDVSGENPADGLTTGVVVAGVMSCLLIVICLTVCILIKRHVTKPPMSLLDATHDNNGRSDLPTPEEDLLISTHPLLGDLLMGEPIKNGEGRFGSVHLGRHVTVDGTSITVAIKVFAASMSQSWLVERGFYTSAKMSCSHENILCFYGDTVVEGAGGEVAQLWLTCEYHSRGSLTSYLTQELLSLHELLTMCQGLANAVEFLHCETPYAVAHRDIKSHNVLVKDDLSVCLADFGLALSFNKRVAEKDRTQKGTRLYMAPEILQGAIDNFVEENYCPVDVYAMALVLWELLSRCSCGTGSVGAYKLPYTAELGDHPDGETVKDHVATNMQRPHFQAQWMQHPVLGILCETIDDCWKSEPMVRIKAATVPHRLAAMREVQKTMTRGRQVSSTSSDTSGISDAASGGASDVTLEMETNCDGAPGSGSLTTTRGHHHDGGHCNQDSGIVGDGNEATHIDIDCSRRVAAPPTGTEIVPNGGTGVMTNCNGITQSENDNVVEDKGDCKSDSQILMGCSPSSVSDGLQGTDRGGQ